MGNYAEIQKPPNSLKQYDLSYKIDSNWYINLSYNNKLNKSTRKPYKDLFSKLSWDLKKNKKRERGSHTDFYTCSLNIWVASSLSRKPKPNHALYQKNYKILQRLHFWIKQNTKILESHKNLNPYIVRSHFQAWNHTKKHSEAQEQPNLSGGSP